MYCGEYRERETERDECFHDHPAYAELPSRALAFSCRREREAERERTVARGVVFRPAAFPPPPPPLCIPRRHSEEILLDVRSIAIGRLIRRWIIRTARSNTLGRMHLMEVSCTRVVAPDRGSRRDAFRFKRTRTWREERIPRRSSRKGALRKSILPPLSIKTRRAFAARRELSGDFSRPAARLNKTESRAWRSVHHRGW